MMREEMPMTNAEASELVDYTVRSIFEAVEELEVKEMPDWEKYREVRVK